jgi:hypothetical protein
MDAAQNYEQAIKELEEIVGALEKIEGTCTKAGLNSCCRKKRK